MNPDAATMRIGVEPLLVSSVGSGKFLLKIHDLLYLSQKPPVNFREIENLLDGEAGAESVADEKDPLRVGHTQLRDDDLARKNIAITIDLRADAPGLSIAAQAASADLERAQAFLQALLERASDGHRLADGFHLGRQGRIGLGELFEGEAGDLRDDVIAGRL